MQDINKQNQDFTEGEVTPEGGERTQEGGLTQNPKSVVEEIKAVRKGRREWKEKYEVLSEEAKTLHEEINEWKEKYEALLGGKEQSTKDTETKSEEPEDELTKKVVEILSKQEQRKKEELRKERLEKAIKKFKQSHPKFNTENDKEGTNFSIVEKELQNFNISGIDTEEGFYEIITKAAKLAGVSIEDNTSETVYTPTSVPVPGGKPADLGAPGSISLTASEKVALGNAGISEARGLELKKNRPEEFDKFVS
jgi:hypothetical protein